VSKSYQTTIVICLVCLFFFNILVTSSLAPSSLPKQTFSWIVGGALFVLSKNINLKQVKYNNLLILVACCFLLSLTLIFGSNVRGSKRWIGTGFFRPQPSEIIKPWLAAILASTQNHLLLIPPLLITLAQPDLGSTISMFLMLIPLFFYNQTIRKHLIILFSFLLLLSPLVWQFGLKDYQKSRITSFINPQADPLGKGYNLIQSQIAIGSANIFGKGYRQGTQGQLLFLPEKHTDFVFAALTEEFGLIGAFLLIGIYFVIVKTLVNKAYQNINNPPYFLFCLIIATQIWSQTFINIGMNIGIMPITGIPLPFMSVGGSSIMSLLISLGIVFSN